MSLPNQNIFNPFNPFTPFNPFGSLEFNKKDNYLNKSFLYILCRNYDNMPVKAYENESDIEIFDSSEYKIIKIPFIKSYIFTKPSKPEFTPHYYQTDNIVTEYDKNLLEDHLDFNLGNNLNKSKF